MSTMRKDEVRIDPLRAAAGKLEPVFKRRALFHTAQMEQYAQYLRENTADTEFVADRITAEANQLRALFGFNEAEASGPTMEVVDGPSSSS